MYHVRSLWSVNNQLIEKYGAIYGFLLSCSYKETLKE